MSRESDPEPTAEGRRRLARVAELALTYPEVGATADPNLPAGYRAIARTLQLGRGRGLFAHVADELSGWEMHRRSGLAVLADSEARPPHDVILTAGRRPVTLTFPCRVVYDVNEERRRGFAYGTLPGHPECGEECFLVELGPEDEVTFRIRAFSRPGSFLGRLARPVGNLVQDYATGRYQRAVRQIAADYPKPA